MVDQQWGYVNEVKDRLGITDDNYDREFFDIVIDNPQAKEKFEVERIGGVWNDKKFGSDGFIDESPLEVKTIKAKKTPGGMKANVQLTYSCVSADVVESKIRESALILCAVYSEQHELILRFTVEFNDIRRVFEENFLASGKEKTTISITWGKIKDVANIEFVNPDPDKFKDVLHGPIINMMKRYNKGK